MANNCYFTMKVIGNKESLEEFARMMSGQGEYGTGRLGRVSAFEPEPVLLENAKGVYSLTADGCCANSVYSAMQKEGLEELAQALGTSPLLSIEDESKRLNLAVEIYSTERDNGFEEHLVVADGKVILEEDIGINEYFVEDIIDRLDEFNEAFKTSYTPADLRSNRLIVVGGFPHYGDFSKLEEIAKNWPLGRDKSLESIMDEAAKKAIEKNANRSEQEKPHKSRGLER